MPPSADHPIAHFADRAAFRAWLAEHHAMRPGLWLRIAKTASPLRSVTIAEALDTALCFGWIDGQRKSHDADSYLQRFTPRTKRSAWSKRNREHVERLIAGGEMQAAGQAAVEAARADGRWERAYDSARSATVPEDLRAALDAEPGATAHFATLTGTSRYTILHRIQTAVRPETRRRRIAEFVTMLGRKPTPRPQAADDTRRRTFPILRMPVDPLPRLRSTCLALPEAHEVIAWGEPTFRVRNRMFATYASAASHHGAGRPAAWVKCAPANQALLVQAEPARFFVPPYVGVNGWVGVWLDRRPRWTQLAALLADAYRRTVPKRVAALRDAASGSDRPRRTPRPRS